ncbi:hypothetical protein K1X76_06100 [bacterium]|nr:hypothetical protein [bacterium]
MRTQHEVLFENSFVMVVNKPAGLPCLPAPGKNSETVSILLIKQFPFLKNVGEPGEAGIVHRLDNDTSGCLAVAKTQEAYEILRKIWNTEAITKEYHAMVIGKPENTGDITTPIAHHATNKKKMRVCESQSLAIKEKAREAFTHYERLAVFKKKDLLFSRVKINILTGVRHQIRVHMASIGHPLAGDKLYQNMDKRKMDSPEALRPLLHLYKLTIMMPGEKEIKVTAPYPEDFGFF